MPSRSRVPPERERQSLADELSPSEAEEEAPGGAWPPQLPPESQPPPSSPVHPAPSVPPVGLSNCHGVSHSGYGSRPPCTLGHSPCTCSTLGALQEAGETRAAVRAAEWIGGNGLLEAQHVYLETAAPKTPGRMIGVAEAYDAPRGIISRRPSKSRRHHAVP